MSVYLTGTTFAGKRVTPSDDGATWAACVHDGLMGSTITINGTSIRLSVGKIIACGRIARVTAQTDFAMANTSGYARLVLTIDLSKSSAQQVALDVEYASSEAGFAGLVQNDVNNGGTKYQAVLCKVALAPSTTTILWQIGPAHGKGYGMTLTLPASWDANNEQTVNVPGVTANTYVVCTYTYAEKEAFQAADIDAAAQGDGWIKFHAVTPPSVPVSAALLLL